MYVPSDLPHSTAGKQRRQIKQCMGQNQSMKCSAENKEVQVFFLGVIILVTVEQGPITIKHEHLLPTAMFLFFPCPVMNQNRITSVTGEGRHRQPEGRQQPGPTAWAVKRLRAREALRWGSAEPSASDKTELMVPTKTKQF